MSTDKITQGFDWGIEAAQALRRAEQAVEDLCNPTVGYRPAPRSLKIALEDVHGRSLSAVVDEACELLTSSGHAPRHRFSLAHMVPPPATVAVIGDFLKAAANQCAFTVQQGPLAPLLEEEVLRWMGEMLGFENGSGGLLTSGGTVSNYAATFLAMERARSAIPPNISPCVIASDQAHFSIAKAVRLIGLPDQALFFIASGPDGRVQSEMIARTVENAEMRGFRPFLFVCTGGTTNAGVLEPILPFAEAAEKVGAWLHIDGAHGAFKALASEPPPNYWIRADSIAWDPHKSLFVPYPSGALILRDPDTAAAFAQRPDYAFHREGARDPAFAHIEGSRGLDALKIWMTIRYFGRSGLREIADHLLSLAAYLSGQISLDVRFKLITEPDTNIVCFRWIGKSGNDADHVNCSVQEALYDEGQYLLSRTRIGGRIALRVVLQNPLTQCCDLDTLLEAVVASAEIIERGNMVSLGCGSAMDISS